MKKLMSLAIGAAALYQVAKKYGIHSFKDVKLFLKSELLHVGKQVKHELVF